MPSRATLFSCLLPVALSLALPAGRADAAEPGHFYVGAGLGVAMPRFNADREQQDANRDLARAGTFTAEFVDKTQRVSGLTLYGGYRFHPNIAAELGFQSFSTTDEIFRITAGGPATYGWKTRGHGIHVTGLGILPVTERLEAFARAGIVAWHVSRDVEATGNASSLARTVSAQDLSPIVGLGLTWRAGERVSVRAEWLRMIQIGDADRTGQFNADFYNLSAQFAY